MLAVLFAFLLYRIDEHCHASKKKDSIVLTGSLIHPKRLHESSIVKLHIFHCVPFHIFQDGRLIHSTQSDHHRHKNCLEEYSEQYMMWKVSENLV